MIQAAKSHDGQQHAEQLFIIHHDDVPCHNSQDWRDIVNSLLGICGSGCPEIAGETCEDENLVILALSISDIISSTTAHIFGTWPVPQGLVYGSSGN